MSMLHPEAFGLPADPGVLLTQNLELVKQVRIGASCSSEIPDQDHVNKGGAARKQDAFAVA